MRRGIAVFIVLGLILCLATFGGIVAFLSSSANREVDVLDGHLRAVAVGESAFAEIVARLTSVPWADRWFKAHADTRFDVPLGDGKYDYLLRDAPAPPAGSPTRVEANRADLLVVATWGQSTVSMFWRLTLAEDSLDPLRRAVPVLFTFGPDGIRPGTPAVDDLTQRVTDLIDERSRNLPGFETTWPPGRGLPAPGAIAGALGVTPNGPVHDPPSGVRGEPTPSPLPPELVGSPPPGGDTALLRLYRKRQQLTPDPQTIRGVPAAGGVAFTIFNQMQCQGWRTEPGAEFTVPDPASITSVTVKITAYNDDDQPSCVHLNVDGDLDDTCGFLGVRSQGGTLVGPGEIPPKQTRSFEYDLAQLPMSGGDPARGGVLSQFAPFTRPGPVWIHSSFQLTSDSEPRSANSWISLELVIHRSTDGSAGR